ncbi:MAG: hypothetical protein AB7O04_04230 [Hyphomonadaceae bacterium]
MGFSDAALALLGNKAFLIAFVCVSGALLAALKWIETTRRIEAIPTESTLKASAYGLSADHAGSILRVEQIRRFLDDAAKRLGVAHLRWQAAILSLSALAIAGIAADPPGADGRATALDQTLALMPLALLAAAAGIRRIPWAGIRFQQALDNSTFGHTDSALLEARHKVDGFSRHFFGSIITREINRGMEAVAAATSLRWSAEDKRKYLIGASLDKSLAPVSRQEAMQFCNQFAHWISTRSVAEPPLMDRIELNVSAPGFTIANGNAISFLRNMNASAEGEGLVTETQILANDQEFAYFVRIEARYNSYLSFPNTNAGVTRVLNSTLSLRGRVHDGTLTRLWAHIAETPIARA